MGEKMRGREDGREEVKGAERKGVRKEGRKGKK